ncbi:uncharacterized protein LOC113504225 [Trichoplusia ni]|uniref:Uncharacterized protein LOC113504225 n=1 Tax=Trichoplusia ni TaxID=7111 RepID=A0A7E5WPW7_TRINI|nr:uncharacterized protein LOC113504225 [Trichoplusia ni]
MAALLVVHLALDVAYFTTNWFSARDTKCGVNVTSSARATNNERPQSVHKPCLQTSDNETTVMPNVVTDKPVALRVHDTVPSRVKDAAAKIAVVRSPHAPRNRYPQKAK